MEIHCTHFSHIINVISLLLHRLVLPGHCTPTRYLLRVPQAVADAVLPRPQSKASKGVPRQAEVAQGDPGRLRPRIILTFRHYKGGRSSAKRTGRLYPRINPWYSTSGHMVLSGVPRKKSRDRPTSSAAL